MRFDINKFIAKILQIGVSLSLILFCISIVESFFNKTNHFEQSFIGILKGLYTFDANATFYTGVIVLMLTPVVRVLCLATLYLIEGDFRFSLISILVFLILIFSVYFGIH